MYIITFENIVPSTLTDVLLFFIIPFVIPVVWPIFVIERPLIIWLLVPRRILLNIVLLYLLYGEISQSDWSANGTKDASVVLPLWVIEGVPKKFVW